MKKAIFTRLFHSTPPLERRKARTPYCEWESRFIGLGVKQTWLLIRDLNSYGHSIYRSRKEDIDEDDPSPSQGPSGFRKQYSSNGSRRHRNGNQRSTRRLNRDDFDFETVFRSAFGGNRSNHGKSWNWRHRSENEYNGTSTDSKSDCSYSGLVSDRLALGLSASGPLKLEDVKKAYRICALKWHPDRHHGSSKVIAEEKFKHCNASYKSLCHKLALD